MEPISTIVMIMLISFPFCCHCVIGFNLIILTWSSEAYCVFHESGKYLNCFSVIFMQESGDSGFSLVPVVEALCGGQRAPAVRHTLGCMLGVSCFTSPLTYICVSPGNDSHTPEQREMVHCGSQIFSFYRCCGFTCLLALCGYLYINTGCHHTVDCFIPSISKNYWTNYFCNSIHLCTNGLHAWKIAIDIISACLWCNANFDGKLTASLCCLCKLKASVANL